MNRRGFIAGLLGIPVAAAVVLKEKAEWKLPDHYAGEKLAATFQGGEVMGDRRILYRTGNTWHEAPMAKPGEYNLSPFIEEVAEHPGTRLDDFGHDFYPSN